MRTSLALALLLVGCSSAQAAVPVSVPAIRVKHATPGDVTLQITNGFSLAISVSELPLSPSGCDPLPLQPEHSFGLLDPSDSMTMTGNVASCNVAIQAQYKSGLAHTCTYNVTYDPSSGGVSVAVNGPWTGSDTSCSIAGNTPIPGTWLFTYEATL